MADEVYEGAIGIDLGTTPTEFTICRLLTAELGTTYSCVANYEGTNVEISTLGLPIQYEQELTCYFLVANEQGSFTTPSFVSFTDEERLIGESAKNQAAMNPANTIFDIK